jgi:hypothetical protein
MSIRVRLCYISAAGTTLLHFSWQQASRYALGESSFRFTARAGAFMQLESYRIDGKLSAPAETVIIWMRAHWCHRFLPGSRRNRLLDPSVAFACRDSFGHLAMFKCSARNGMQLYSAAT